MSSVARGSHWQWRLLTILVVVGQIVVATAPFMNIRSQLNQHLNDKHVSNNNASTTDAAKVNNNATSQTTVPSSVVISSSSANNNHNLFHNHLLDTHEFYKFHKTIPNNKEQNRFYYLYQNNSAATTTTSAAVTPLFWHIPKTGGTTMLSLFDNCLKFVVASQIGKRYSDETELRIVTLPSGVQVVNVDTTSLEGIEHAKQLGFNIHSTIYDSATTTTTSDITTNNNNIHVDMIMAVRLRPVIMNLFNENHKGQLFTMIRHPIERAVSLFYYLQDADWEVTYSPELKNLTLLEYFQDLHSNKENNWMTRMLSGQLRSQLNATHLQQAKRILRQKALIGIFEQLELSLNRLGQFFEWNTMPEYPNCLEQSVHHGLNTHQHPKIIENSPEWEAAKHGLEYDIELYHYAVELFQNQSIYFPNLR